MMSIDKEKWFPINLSKKEQETLNGLTSFLEKNDQKLDRELLKITDERINILFKENVDIIVDRNSLPNLSHLICGWGNFIYQGEPIIEKISDFIFSENGNPYVKQCHPEGDFHPWQSFAYMSMAGIDFEKERIKDFSLKDIAFNSVYIKKDKGEELGHLLFAFANNYKKEDLEKIFYMGKSQYTLEELVQNAIHAHEYGGFEVCRKFHLSEGLCAITSKIPTFHNYHEEAQRFLDGQTDMVGLIQLIFEQITEANGDLEILSSVRDKMVILDYFENHIYYLGHAIENACFGLINGFHIRKYQYNLMIKAVNTANQFLTDFGLSSISFLESFLSLGHYRRAAYLLSEIDVHIDEELKLSNSFDIKKALTSYTVDLNKIANIDQINIPPNNSTEKEYFLFSEKDYSVRPKLKTIIEHETLKNHEIVFKGGFEHFRRYHPDKWPRSIHYEVIEYNNSTIGVEIHIEDKEYQKLYSDLENIYKGIPENFTVGEFSLDPDWYNCGRLKINFSPDTDTTQIVDDFLKLIEVSQKFLGESIDNIVA